jgi:hypothetical protein
MSLELCAVSQSAARTALHFRDRVQMAGSGSWQYRHIAVQVGRTRNLPKHLFGARTWLKDLSPTDL